ncbi:MULTISPECIES: hypothetical protein [Mycobacterium]|uniref:Uncharacterized protein n=1 Tax=Mycobacterium syngnathidarum TaxID=1908205 RepID=A0A1Q9WB94_9MYCO|nr:MULTISPECIES: hypothetical protein [Mycobacterium]MCG7605815.1 hypothetical protein [Mycobacterium sp. CnD-18-1]OHT92613.1 hypothetical protein BKG61_23400 [Mycobacterium syngnathidarum]OLT95949.1 hypothetical protein BKG60_13955 [Mycobacterium syngnathidarum]
MQLATASRLSSATTARAVMLMMGLIVIVFHQYWYRVTAALISPFGWFVALRELAMAARIFFLLMTAMGLWLTYVGRRREHTPDVSAVTV